MPKLHYPLAALLLACLLPLPYAYYQFVRWAAMLTFALLAYHYYEGQQKSIAIVLIGLALLFQPFAKVALGRTGWNIVDVIVAIGLIWLASKETCKKSTE